MSRGIRIRKWPRCKFALAAVACCTCGMDPVHSKFTARRGKLNNGFWPCHFFALPTFLSFHFQPMHPWSPRTEFISQHHIVQMREQME